MEGYYFKLGGEILGYVCPECGSTLTTTADEDYGHCTWCGEDIHADRFERDGQTAEAITDDILGAGDG